MFALLWQKWKHKKCAQCTVKTWNSNLIQWEFLNTAVQIHSPLVRKFFKVYKIVSVSKTGTLNLSSTNNFLQSKKEEWKK